MQLGIGVSIYVEITGGVGNGENAKIEVHDDGTATIYTGTSPHGQGHDTAWSMIASAQTGIPIDKFTLVWGDTDRTPVGDGTMGSRSLQQGGAAVDKAAIELVEAAKPLAAQALEAAEADIELDLESGTFHVAGTPAVSKSWADLAVLATGNGSPLTIDTRFDAPGATFPFGAHVAVVEVDTETGQVTLSRIIACDDAGTVINPLLLDGQRHGGLAQGAAQALLEEVRYDADGNPITSNLADYAMISATELPSFELVPMETPTPVNPLGAKGIGESGLDRLDAGDPVRRRRRGQPPRRPPHRHADHRRARVAGDPGGRQLTSAPRTVLPDRPDRAAIDGQFGGATVTVHGVIRRTHVLIDLDGTITDSFPAITGSLKVALAELGLPIPSDEVLRAVVGPPFELGLPLVGVPGDRLWAVIDRYRVHYEAGGLFECELYDGVVEMLDDLRAAGITLSLATAKPEETAVRIVEHFGLTDRFAVLAGATYEPGRRTKDEVITHALRELEHRPRAARRHGRRPRPRRARRQGPRHRLHRRRCGATAARRSCPGRRRGPRRHAGRRRRAREQ